MKIIRNHKILNSVLLMQAVISICIVLYHLATEISVRFNSTSLLKIFVFGQTGVDMFFVLSGFLLYRSYGTFFGKRQQVDLYIFKRFLRIFPTYWIISLTIIVLHLMNIYPVPSGLIFNLPYIISVIFLLPYGVDSTPAVWYLEHQIFLYVLFMATFYIRNIRTVIKLYFFYVVAIYAYLFLVHIFPLPKYLYDFTTIVFSPYILEFGIGVFLGWLIKEKSLKPVIYKIIVITGILTLFTVHGLLSFVLKSDYYLNTIRWLTYGVPYALIIFGFVGYEQLNAFKLPSLIHLLGKSSYVLYLSHYFIIQLLFSASSYWLITSHNTLALAVVSIGIFVICLLFAVSFHLFVEKKITDVLLKSHFFPTKNPAM